MCVRLYAQTVLIPPVFHFVNFVQCNKDLDCGLLGCDIAFRRNIPPAYSFRSWEWRHYIPSKLWYLPISLCSVTTQRTTIWTILLTHLLYGSLRTLMTDANSSITQHLAIGCLACIVFWGEFSLTPKQQTEGAGAIFLLAPTLRPVYIVGDCQDLRLVLSHLPRW